jgi:hypothetical protein
MLDRLASHRRSIIAAVALVALSLVPIIAVASSGEARSKASIERQVSKLSKKVKKLNRKVKALQAAPGTPGPAGATGPTGPSTGPAGGALIGTFPDPRIAPDAIGSAEVTNNTLTAFDLAGGESTDAITLGAGYVADGRCRDTNIAVAGAVPGDAVVLSINGSVPQGILIYGARVPSADTVTLKVCNLSGAVMTAIPDLPIAVVTIGI